MAKFFVQDGSNGLNTFCVFQLKIHYIFSMTFATKAFANADEGGKIHLKEAKKSHLELA